MSGGVRNLRAMFENKEESSVSPPDRGRSPAGSIGGGSNGTSPRPLSKVRTSFVAVERSGQTGTQWGLRKENSNSNIDPSLKTRRTSFSIDEELAPGAIAEKNEAIGSELSKRKNSAVTETIPEFAIESPAVDSEKRLGYTNGKPMRGKSSSSESKPGVNSDKKSLVEDRNARLLPGDPTSSTASGGGRALNDIGGFGEEIHGSTDNESKLGRGPKSTAKVLPAVRPSKPTPIPTSQLNAPSKPEAKSIKSPPAPKTPSTATAPGRTPTTLGKLDRSPAVKSSSTLQAPTQTRALEKKASKASLASAHSSKAVSRPAPTSSTVNNASEKKATLATAANTSIKKAVVASPPSTFHKPRPKSPTKPIKLPSSLTAPTSSSLSKVAAAAAPSARPSLATSTKSVSRSPSRTSLGLKQELRRKSSRLENARPALGPPPSASVRKQPSRQSLLRQAGPADESFLARMMRPTTASASKTHEKVVTPPRPKPAASRPTTRDGAGHHKPHDESKGSPSTERLPVILKTTAIEGVKNAEADQAEILATTDIEADEVISTTEDKGVGKDAATGDLEPTIAPSHQDELTKASIASPDAVVEPEVPVTADFTDVSVEKPVEEDEIKAVDEVPHLTNTEPKTDKATIPDKSSRADEEFVHANKSISESVVLDEPKVAVPVSEDISAVHEPTIPNDPKITEEDDAMGVD